MEAPDTTTTAYPSEPRSPAASALPRFEPRRRDLSRTAIIGCLATALALVVVGVGLTVGSHLAAAWWLENHQGMVLWDLNESSWRQGGATSVSFAPTHFRMSQLIDADLAHLHGLHRVVSLTLAEIDGIGDSGLAELRGLDDLTDLNLDRLNRYRSTRSYLTSTPLTDACIVHLRALPRLETLSLAGNLITDRGLSQLAAMSGLKTLDLSATEISDAGLVYLAAMKRLESVNLGATQITKEGLAKLRLARPDLAIEFNVDPEVAHGIEKFRGETQ